MNDETIPQPVGDLPYRPITFPRFIDLCERLDRFYESSDIQLKEPPSNILRGAFFVMNESYRENNPDWKSQAAHSIREIFYVFDKKSSTRRSLAVEKYGSTYRQAQAIPQIGQYHNFFTEIAHHNFEEASSSSLVGGSKQNPSKISDESFINTAIQYCELLFAVLRKQLDAHQEIYDFFSQDIEQVSADTARSLIDINLDAYQYFFAQADERWLDWLWQNGFLDTIKEPAQDSTSYNYRLPELNYLVRMAEKDPEKVVEIMMEVPISKDSFNPKVIDQFTRICSKLPVDQLARIVPKIHQDNWIELMDKFNRWAFDYKDMLETLSASGDSDSILKLADVLLTIKTAQEVEDLSVANDDPFFVDDLSYTQVFTYLSQLEGKDAEAGFMLLTKKVNEVISLGEKPEEKNVFELEDRYSLYRADFFNIHVNKSEFSHDESVRQLFATLKVLADKTFPRFCDEQEDVIQLYQNTIGSCPDSSLSWRLKLYVLTLCPDAFKSQLKEAFFRLFETENGIRLLYGTEYYKALQEAFIVLDESDKKAFVNNTVSYFDKSVENAEENDKHWIKGYGSRVLSCVIDYLNQNSELKNMVIEAGYTLEPNYKPEPTIGNMRGGAVSPRGPISQEEFDTLSVQDIAEKLKNDWSPSELHRKYADDDFLNPRSAEGASRQLQSSISKRLDDFVSNADLFFDAESLSPQYTYSFLRGIQEAIKDPAIKHNSIRWSNLIQMLIRICETSFDEQGENEKRTIIDAWIANWRDVNSIMAELIKELLRKNENVDFNFSDFRSELLTILESLLYHPDPTRENEEPESATITTKRYGQPQLVSAPFNMAINSVRGKAFEAFVHFVYIDGKSHDEPWLSKETKTLYENVLRQENTRAIMSMFGHYLPTFYYRDKEWLKTLLPQIFPNEEEKSYLYLASWEGYLANNLYEEIFFDPAFQELYTRGLGIEDIKETHREYFKDPSEGIAIHLALAHMFYEGFDENHELFKLFWADGSIDQHKSFISFIGRMFLLGDNQKADELLKEKSWPKERLIALWEDLLSSYQNPELFEEFGTWISLEKDVFEPSWLASQINETLSKTNGRLNFDYELIKTMPELAKASPQDALEIARKYLLENIAEDDKQYLRLENEWIQTLTTLYQVQETKSETYNLINNLIEKGGRPFWDFKQVLDD